MRCHYKTKHLSLVQTYLQHSVLRDCKIPKLRAWYDRVTRILSHYFPAQDHANENLEKFE